VLILDIIHVNSTPMATSGSVDELVTVTAAKPFPFNAPRGRLALLNIDWQRVFLEPGVFGASAGNNMALLQAALGRAAALLQAARAAGMLVFHTLEAHKPDLSNLPASKKRRFSAIGEVLDESRGRMLIEGEPGNAIVDAVAPIPGEFIINKPGKGAFWKTNLEDELQRLGITHLLVTGVTTEVCVQTTIREANDRGYECLLVTDATESYFPEFKAATLQMIVAQGGIAGWTASTADVIPAIQAAGVGGGPLAGDVRLGPMAGKLPPASARGFRTTLLAVSGTLQCGFELRANLDHPEMAAVLIGAAVVRGVKAYLDIKEAGCREHRAPPELARVNPANVVTGARSDANLYAVYLVHEAVVTSALIGKR
jgi:nicotinamidase-related amidase